MKYVLIVFVVVICYSGSVKGATKLIDGTAANCTHRITIIDQHNAHRKNISQGKLTTQPKSSNMNFLIWDTTLSTLAQNHANKMVFSHSTNTTDSRFLVGENMYMYSITSSTFKGFNWTAVINAWYSENIIYTYGNKITSSTGHYTQVVWADTKYVGCGASYFKADIKYYKSIYVCNYGPAGNTGLFPYAKGTGCESLCCTHCTNNTLYGSDCTA